jgi:hypothetical protein
VKGFEDLTPSLWISIISTDGFFKPPSSIRV